MRTRTVFLIAVSALLFSCNQGWTDELRTELIGKCRQMMERSYEAEDATAICGCYVEGLVAKYPKAEYTAEQNTAEMSRCAEGYITRWEKEEALRAEQEPVMLPDSLSADSIGAGQ